MAEIRSVAGAITVEIDKVKGSRFIADLAPATDETAGRHVIERVRQRESSASHHCWAYRLSGGQVRANDDGEPRDTAGAPILRHLVGADLENVVVVVTRYYGGTNLGRGGLIRAYGDATAAAIDAASIVTKAVRLQASLDYPYDLSSAIDGVLSVFEATVMSATYGERIHLDVLVDAERVGAFAEAVRESTAGQISPRLP